MFAASLLMFFLYISIVTSTLDYLHHPVKSCHIGDVVQNQCIKCLCTSKAVFECTSIDCDKTKTIETQESNDINNPICLPNQLYVQNLITCICTKDGRWPHKSCQETFLSLPPTSVVQHKCEPDSYVAIDCNVCKCGHDGEFIPNRCTKNTCEHDASRRHHKNANDRNSVYSHCQVKTWYSLAPCQFCFCVNENKLVCNTGNDQTKKLELGTYEMQVCGTDLIKEALELIPAQEVKKDEIESYTETATAPTQKTTTARVNKKHTKNVNAENHKKKKKIYLKASKHDKKEQDYDEQNDVEESKGAKKNSSEIDENNTSREKQTEISEEEKSGSSSEENNSNEIDNDNISDETKALLIEAQKARRAKTVKKSVNNNDVMDTHFPYGLGEIISKVFRKSMVTLDNKSKCKPGTTFAKDCNTCFCLKNGKLLCSSQSCS